MIRFPLNPALLPFYDQDVVRSAREDHDTTLDLVGVVISNRGQLTHPDNMMTSLTRSPGRAPPAPAPGPRDQSSLPIVSRSTPAWRLRLKRGCCSSVERLAFCADASVSENRHQWLPPSFFRLAVSASTIGLCRSHRFPRDRRAVGLRLGRRPISSVSRWLLCRHLKCSLRAPIEEKSVAAAQLQIQEVRGKSVACFDSSWSSLPA